MATRGIAQTVCFVAWDTSANAGKTGDGANFTMRWVKDGTSAALTTTTVTEIDSTNAPGLYKVGISSTESDCNIGYLAGKSSTSGISIMPVKVEFERLPDAAPSAAGGVLDTTRFGGTTVTGRDIGASVLLSSGTGTGQVSLTSGTVTVGTNNDKTGYSLTQSFPSNFSSLAITVGGAVTAGTVSDKTGYSLTQSFPSNFASLGINSSGHISRVTLCDTITTYTGNTVQTGDAYARLGAPTGASVSADIVSVLAYLARVQAGLIVRTSTSQAGGNTSITLDSGASSTDNEYVGAIIVQNGQARVCKSYVGSTKVATIDRAWSSNPTTTTYYIVSPQSAALTVAGAIDTVSQLTNNNDKTGYSLASSPPTASTIAAAVWDLSRTGHTTSGTFGEITAATAQQQDLVDAASDVNQILSDAIAIKAKTDNLPSSPAAVGSAMTLATDSVTSTALATSAVTEIVSAIFANAPTESYASDGSAPTLAEFLYMIYSVCAQFGVSGTSLTSKKLDGTTTAMTFTLDDDTNPTSRTRSG